MRFVFLRKRISNASLLEGGHDEVVTEGVKKKNAFPKESASKS